MTVKNDHWRGIRQQKRREKSRIRQKNKPIREKVSHSKLMEKKGFNVFGLLSRPVAEIKKRIRKQK